MGIFCFLVKTLQMLFLQTQLNHLTDCNLCSFNPMLSGCWHNVCWIGRDCFIYFKKIGSHKTTFAGKGCQATRREAGVASSVPVDGWRRNGAGRWNRKEDRRRKGRTEQGSDGEGGSTQERGMGSFLEEEVPMSKHFHGIPTFPTTCHAFFFKYTK